MEIWNFLREGTLNLSTASQWFQGKLKCWLQTSLAIAMCAYVTSWGLPTCKTKPQLLSAWGWPGLSSIDLAYFWEARWRKNTARAGSDGRTNPASSLKATPQLYSAACNPGWSSNACLYFSQACLPHWNQWLRANQPVCCIWIWMSISLWVQDSTNYADGCPWYDGLDMGFQFSE